MPLYESSAVTLRSIRLGEADKIVTFFTRDFGKIKAVAKGAYRPKSRFGGRLEPFALVRVIAFGKEKAELYRLNSCDMIDPFMRLRGDVGKLSRVYVSAELVDVCQREGDVNRQGLEALLGLWRLLADEERPERQDLLLRLFEIRYMSYIGYRPFLDRCASCGGEVTGEKVGFNPFKGGAVCRACAAVDSAAFGLSMGALRLISKSLATPMRRQSRLSAAPGLIAELESVVGGMISAHVRRRILSEKFLKLQDAG